MQINRDGFVCVVNPVPPSTTAATPTFPDMATDPYEYEGRSAKGGKQSNKLILLG